MDLSTPEPTEPLCRADVLAQRERRVLAFHILPASGQMLGVCVTLIGLVKIAEARTGPSSADKYAGLVALFFLSSALTSYLSLRQAHRPNFARRVERVADLMFLSGLVGITGVAILFAYELI